jgi:hypothetical protein
VSAGARPIVPVERIAKMALPILQNIEKSAESNVLWPPIADALGTFIRRRAAGADGYELTWRLIHVWEAVASVLTGAVTSRLRHLDSSAPAYLRCREHLHGRTWDPLSKTFNRSQGALDGSATRRIDLLWGLDTIDPSGSRFLDSAKRFLATRGLDLRPLVTSWKHICDVPDEATASNDFAVREALRHLNTFRNRFAHVPFPYDEMAAVADTFAQVTEDLFAIDPKPWQSFPDERCESPLNGAIDCRNRRLRGSMPPQLSQMDSTEPCFVFPATPTKPADLVETWEAAPFVLVDSMFRPSILTRLVSDANGVWEYTRFLAERNSVIRYERPQYLATLAVPVASEYPVPPDEQHEEEQVTAPPPSPTPSAEASPSPAPTPESELDRALRDIANEEYEPAIEFFQELVQGNPSYHIGWLRLGHALRELAMRKRLGQPDEAAVLFTRSIDALTTAAEHSHVPRRAQALYERSKAYYHRSRQGETGAAEAGFAAALKDAEEAFELSPDTRYETWINYLQQHRPIAPRNTTA